MLVWAVFRNCATDFPDVSKEIGYAFIAHIQFSMLQTGQYNYLDTPRVPATKGEGREGGEKKIMHGAPGGACA